MWEDSINELIARREKLKYGGGEKRIQKQHESGRLTSRERLELLFDGGTFVEIGSMIESRIDDFGLAAKRVPGDGVQTGYGKINGRYACAIVEDFTVIGGTLGEYHAMKIAEALDFAIAARVPFICVYDSGGARIEEGICSLSGYSSMFVRQVAASGVIPQIAVIVGPCSGGACYSPALCDFIFMVRDIGKMFITGPKVVKTVLGEEVTADELGGVDMHANKSGVIHFSYDQEQSCFDGVKQLLSYLPQSNSQQPPVYSAMDYQGRERRDFCDVVPDNPRRAYDIRTVMKLIADKDSFFEVQRDFAKNTVIAFTRVDGNTVGFVGNQPMFFAGSLDCDGSDKIARFIRFCDCFNIPLVTFVDVPAFCPGTEQEHKGIIRHGAKIIYAYSEAQVPKITVILRKAYGGAYIAMESKKLGVDAVYAWPVAEIAVMGAEGAVEIIFHRQIEAAADPAAEKARLKAEYEDVFMNPYIAAKRGYVDEIILPEETPQRIRTTLDVLKNKRRVPAPDKHHGNIPL